MEASADPEIQRNYNASLMTSSWLIQGVASQQRVKFHFVIYVLWIKKKLGFFAQRHKMKVLNFSPQISCGFHLDSDIILVFGDTSLSVKFPWKSSLPTL